MNESLFQPFGLEIDLSSYIILYILFSLLIPLVVKFTPYILVLHARL